MYQVFIKVKDSCILVKFSFFKKNQVIFTKIAQREKNL